MISSIVRRQTPLQLLVILCGAWASAASWACRDLAITPLEQTYCALAERGLTQGLPRFDDFRRNPQATQYLLLKRPAEKARLPLQAPADKASRLRQTGPSTPKPASPAAQALGARLPATPSTTRPRANTPTPPGSLARALTKTGPQTTGMADCQLLPLQIVCGRSRYVLRDNQRNSQLSADAFSQSNRLIFPSPKDSDVTDDLQRLYTLYLDKMLLIGLGGATLSYRKFEFLYGESKRQQSDFNARFATMYDFLKKDKQAQDADKMHSGKSAPPLSDCQSFGTDLIACDAQQGNWVYRLER